jgi:glycosyltransferase involved in cell wall biosynthesis
MKILHTFESYNADTGARGVKTLSEELVRRGHDVTVAAAGAKRSTEILNGVRVERFPISGNAVRGIRGPEEATAEYKTLLCDPRFDVVMNYAAQSWATDIAFSVLEKIKARKVIVPCGYSKLGDVNYAGYFRALPEFLKAYDQIVYLSGGYKDRKFGDAAGVNAPGKFSVIPNCADPKEFLEAPDDFRKRHGINEAMMVVGVSNHAYAKRHEYFWATAARFFGRSRSGPVAFVLVGNAGPGLKTCYWPCRLASMLGPHTYSISNISRADVISALKAADIFLHTSRTECDPIVMYEAFAAGLPIVATPAGSMPEFSPPIFIGKDPRELAKSIRSLLESETLRRERSAASKRLAEQFTLTKMVDAYEKLYASLVAS